MKKAIILSILILSLLGFLPKNTLAIESFECGCFPKGYVNFDVGVQTDLFINFSYSKLVKSGLSVSIMGDNLPSGMELGPVIYAENGDYSVVYSGIPTKAGSYPLTLTFSDNNGATLVKKFNFNVDGFTFNDKTLPHAILYKPYSQNMSFTYSLKDFTPIIIFYDFPYGLDIRPTNPYVKDNSFTLELTPREVGQFTFKVQAMYGNVELATKILSLTVDDPNQTKVVNGNQPVSKEINNIQKTQQNDTITSDEQKEDITSKTNPELIKIKWYQKIFNWFVGLFQSKKLAKQNSQFPPSNVECFDIFMNAVNSGYANGFKIPSFNFSDISHFKCASEIGFDRYEITGVDKEGHSFYIYKDEGGMAASGSDGRDELCYKKDDVIITNERHVGRDWKSEIATCAWTDKYLNPTSTYEYNSK